ncbi:hypothetical protein [Gloeobacter violaceus]|uniref:hypothetical protein n=1 Tax=Gloeobacter violaceus TaxID=33072 RepID=UPI0013E8C449|nr:hypothetical protein [Gloeobacter violaceus]
MPCAVERFVISCPDCRGALLALLLGDALCVPLKYKKYFPLTSQMMYGPIDEFTFRGFALAQLLEKVCHQFNQTIAAAR